uniref:Uncharacterized protein n=1 Tax=Ditylenchus dipsaci TaxID=166011 RepID=A0A915DPU6_9BILA
MPLKSGKMASLVAAPLDSSYEFYPYSGQQPQVFLVEPYYGGSGYGNILSSPYKRSSGSAVKRERIVMDAMGGDYLIRKRTL